MNEEQLLKLLEGVYGYLVPGQEFWLYRAAQSLADGDSILEIGTHKGRSTAAMGLACLSTSKHIHTIECHAPYADEAIGNFERLGISQYITVHVVEADSLLKLWGPIPRFAFAFIDGNHSSAALLTDFLNVSQVVVPGGTIAFHDVCDMWPEVQAVWNHVASKVLSNHKFCSSIACGTTPK